MGRKKTKVIYLIGSLKNRKKIIDLANRLRELGFEVFDDWIAPGPDADDYWRDYEKRRGSSYKQALKNYAATHIFEFDKYHIDRSDIGVLYMPAGKSAHLELGYMIGRGKPCFVLFDEEPERWDVMYQFATAVCFSYEELVKELKKYLK
jgi:nucleoside 2-deoxyribosyltransferase